MAYPIARGLGWLGLGVGVAHLVAPRRVARWVGLGDRHGWVRGAGVGVTGVAALGLFGGRLAGRARGGEAVVEHRVAINAPPETCRRFWHDPDRRADWLSTGEAAWARDGDARFEAGPAGRGTMVTVQRRDDGPSGVRGALARVWGEAPRRRAETDLRRFKQLVEAGEVATTRGQPAGRRSLLVRAIGERRLP